MTRFETINVISGSKTIDYELPSIEFDDSITDRSHFVPMSESVKRLKGMAPVSGDTIKMMYDFPDGKDTGNAVPSSRRKSIDIAELSNDIRNEISNISTELENASKKAKQAKEVNKIINFPSASSGSSDSTV